MAYTQQQISKELLARIQSNYIKIVRIEPETGKETDHFVIVNSAEEAFILAGSLIGLGHALEGKPIRDNWKDLQKTRTKCMTCGALDGINPCICSPPRF